jgi:hypothetical protein
MATRGKPEIRTGHSLDVQPGVSNIGENQATLEALRNANIDGQDVFPQSVSTRRFSAEDGAFSGNIYSGGMLVGANGVTVTSDPDLGTPATGLHIASSTLQLIKSGVAQVTLNGTTGDATFIGAVTATSGTFTGTIQATAGYFVGSITIGTDVSVGGAATGTWLTNTRLLMKYGGASKIDFNTATNTYNFSGGTITAMSSVNFGTSITIGGDIVMNATSVDGKIRFDGPSGNIYIDYDAVFGSISAFGLVDTAASSSDIIGIGQGSASWTTLMNCPYIIINAGSIDINTSGASGPNSSTRDIQIDIGTGSGNTFALKRGGTDVMSFNGNSSTVTFGGAIVGNSTIGTSTGFYGPHKSTGGLARSNGSFTFYAAATSGGAVTQKHDITFTDGLVTTWTVT